MKAEGRLSLRESHTVGGMCKERNLFAGGRVAL